MDDAWRALIYRALLQKRPINVRTLFSHVKYEGVVLWVIEMWRVCCSVLQCVAVFSYIVWLFDTWRNLLHRSHNLIHRTFLSILYASHAASHCNALQRTATHCNTLQRTVTLCNTCRSLRDLYQVGVKGPPATHCNTQFNPHCNILQHTLQHAAIHCNTQCNTHCFPLDPDRYIYVWSDSFIRHTHNAIHCNTLQHTATCVLYRMFL